MSAGKSLRILTGQHAGAQLRLVHSKQRIGSDDDADIQITDWQHDTVDIRGDETTGTTWLARQGANDDGHATDTGSDDKKRTAEVARSFVDFMPQRFGGVVLCVGPSEATWPGDTELLAHLMHERDAGSTVPAPSLSRPPLRRRAWAVRGVLACAVLGAGLFGVGYITSAAGAKSPAPPASLAQQVREALVAAGANTLRVRDVGRGVAVEGLLDDNVDVLRVRAALLPFGSDAVLHRYAAAPDVTRALADAVGAVGVQVAYEGAGVFSVSGQTRDLARLRETLQRVGADLGAHVARIEVRASQSLSPGGTSATATATAMLAGDDLQYVESRNGTKHLSVVQARTETIGVPQDNAAPATTAPLPTHPDRSP